MCSEQNSLINGEALITGAPGTKTAMPHGGGDF
jgi:hypothetical protein